MVKKRDEWNAHAHDGHESVHVLRWEDVECECVSVSCCGHVRNHRVHVTSGLHANDHDSPLASMAAMNASASENGYLR